MKIERILSRYDDEESERLREFVRNNEDLHMKLGNLGIQNIYLYLEDSAARKLLVEKIYGSNKKKKKRMQTWQKENENLNAIREKIKKRYQVRNQLKLNEQSDEEQLQN